MKRAPKGSWHVRPSDEPPLESAAARKLNHKNNRQRKEGSFSHIREFKNSTVAVMVVVTFSSAKHCQVSRGCSCSLVLCKRVLVGENLRNTELTWTTGQSMRGNAIGTRTDRRGAAGDYSSSFSDRIGNMPLISYVNYNSLVGNRIFFIPV